MNTRNYEKLTMAECFAVEEALNTLRAECARAEVGVTLASDGRETRAAEALARFVIESRT